MSLESAIERLCSLIEEDIAIRKEAVEMAKGGIKRPETKPVEEVEAEEPKAKAKPKAKPKAKSKDEEPELDLEDEEKVEEKPKKRRTRKKVEETGVPDKAEIAKRVTNFLAEVDKIYEEDSDEADEEYNRRAELVLDILKEYGLKRVSDADESDDNWADIVEDITSIRGFPKK